jgi:hypothetical protein
MTKSKAVRVWAVWVWKRDRWININTTTSRLLADEWSSVRGYGRRRMTSALILPPRSTRRMKP